MALNVAIMAATVDKENYASFHETKSQGKRLFAIGGNRADIPLGQDSGTQRKFKWSRECRRGFADREAGHNSRRRGDSSLPPVERPIFCRVEEPVAPKGRGNGFRTEEW